MIWYFGDRTFLPDSMFSEIENLNYHKGEMAIKKYTTWDDVLISVPVKSVIITETKTNELIIEEDNEDMEVIEYESLET